MYDPNKPMNIKRFVDITISYITEWQFKSEKENAELTFDEWFEDFIEFLNDIEDVE